MSARVDQRMQDGHPLGRHAKAAFVQSVNEIGATGHGISLLQ
jgi:hypothetical protein